MELSSGLTDGNTVDSGAMESRMALVSRWMPMVFPPLTSGALDPELHLELDEQVESILVLRISAIVVDFQLSSAAPCSLLLHRSCMGRTPPESLDAGCLR
mmetsp:Transcript_28811/g.75936  ORF Transcript_28811/g.75936 Transcript_28811/m.75936 type:complete len:100 (-) Transcript_28811:249-548(-)